MIKNLKYKRIIALILIIITMLSISQPIFAASGSAKWVGGQFASYIKTTDNANTEYGVLLRKLTNYTTKEQRTVFCAEHGVDIYTGIIYNGKYYKPVDSNIKKACKIAYLGWYKEHGNYVIDGGTSNALKKQYVLTQQFIWETLGQSSAKFINSGIQSEYVSFKSNIEEQIKQIEKRPSFDGTIIDVQAGESKTLNDSNGVLASYPDLDKTINGIRVQHSNGSNSITIYVDENTNLESYTITDADFKSWGMIKDGTQDEDTMVYLEFEEGVQNQLYSMAYNDPVTLSFSLKIESFGKIELQKLNTNGDLINGAVFNVRGPNDYNKDVIVTNGKITIDKLKKGTYTIVEKSVPYGYLIDTKAYDVEVKVNQTATKAIVNEEPTGEIKVYKTDTYSNKLKGAEISLYAKEDIKNAAGTIIWHKKGDLIAKATTNEQGMVTFSNLHLGYYYVKETNAPDGYLLNTKEFDANIQYKDQNTKVIYLEVNDVKDNEPTGTISIVKKDSKTGSIPQGDAVFTGAVYKVYAKEDIYNKAKTKKFYSKGDLVATRTMNEKGITEDITNLPLGKYMVKEGTASLGYMLDTKEYDVNLGYKDQNTKVVSNTTTSLEKVKEMGVHIFKSGIKENSGETPGLEGAEFTIKLNSAVERAYSKGYTYAEVWNGIDEDGNKVDVDSKRVAEAQVIAPTYEIIKTDNEGNAYTQNNLPYGKYIVKETKTPTDYETSVDFTFSITDDETEIKEIPKKTKHIVVNNEQLESYIKIVKKDLKTGKSVTLNSTTFEIKATKDIYDRATKKILFKKGETISQKVGNTTYTSFTTNADNIVVPDNSFNSTNDNKSEVTTPLKLPVGSYEITEIKIPDGFLQLDKPVAFEIKNIKDYDTDKDGDFIKEVVIKNEQPTGTIKLDKTIAIRENVDTSLIDTSDLSGIEFKLSAKEDIIDKADGSKIYKKGQEIKKYNLTKNGKLTITDLPMGVYEIVETKTLDGLVLNTTKYEVKFEQKDLSTKVYTEQLNVLNDTTLVEFSKTDVTGDKELKGAKLSVLDSENNVIDEWTSTDKTHKIEGLTIGKEYTLKEEIAPEGYVIATSIKFTINASNEIQKVNMKDKIVVVTKTDMTNGNELEGAEMEVTDEDGNVLDNWISTKEPHQVKGLEEGKTYILKETTAPYGYEITEEIKFIVTTDKETQKIEMKDMPILKNVKVIKVDSDTKEIIKDKFIFGIYEDPECTKLIKEIKSNKKDGTALFEDLRYGTYYIKEIKAPKDYELSSRIAKVEINDKGIFVDAEQVEETDSTIEFTFENKKIEIPKTGDESKMKLFAVVILLSLVGLAYIVIRNQKNKQN